MIVRLLRLILAMLLIHPLSSRGKNNDDDAPSPAHLQGSKTPPQGEVHLTPQQHSLAALTIEELRPLRMTEETQSVGKVEDILPLLTLRSHMRAARAELEIATAARALAQKNRERIKTLFQADIIAGRELLQVESQWQTDSSRLEAARLHVEDLRREADQQLGKALAQKVLESPSTFLDQLATHHKALIKITLPEGHSLSLASHVLISKSQNHSEAITATLLSAAPHTDDLVQGETWFFESVGGHLRAGMRVNAWIQGEHTLQGVALPTTAIVYHQGSPFVYLHQGNGRFQRVAISPRPGRTMNERLEIGLQPGQQIVTSGAQMLLAEEFRPQIPEEDD